MAQPNEVQLGDLVQDRITGLTGICWGITRYLAGCNRIHIQPRELKADGTTHESSAFDEPMVGVIERSVCLPDQSPAPKKTSPPGGLSYLDPAKPKEGQR